MLLGMDFVGPFPYANLTIEEAMKASMPELADVKILFPNLPPPKPSDPDQRQKTWNDMMYTHIFLLVDYFDRFVNAIPTMGDRQAEAIRALNYVFTRCGFPCCIYHDPGSHFVGVLM